MNLGYFSFIEKERLKTMGEKIFKRMNIGVIIPFLFSLLILLLFSRNQLFQHQIYPSGDLAADMLLNDQIDIKGYLLTGQYSRFGFHHPGPFYFYVTWIFEKIFSRFFPSMAAIWILTMIFLNSLFLAIASLMIFHKSNMSQDSLLIKRIIFIALTIFYFKKYMISVWPPDKIMIPFMAFLITLPYIFERKFVYLPFSIFFASVLFHGRVDSPLFTVPALILSLVLAFYRRNKLFSRLEFRYFSLSFFIGLGFLIPMIVDSFISHPTNLNLIVASSRSLRISTSSWHDVLLFLLNFILKNESLLFFILIFLILFIYFNMKQLLTPETKLKYFSIILLIETIIFIFYFKSTPSPLYFYMGEFYLIFPFLLSIYLFMYILESSSYMHIELTKIKFERLVFISFFSVFILDVFLFPAPLITDQDPSIPKLTKAFLSLTKPGEEIRIKSNDSNWPIIAGLLLEFYNEKHQSCATIRQLSFLFSQSFTCSRKKHTNFILIKKNNCDNRCNKVIEGYGIISLRIGTHLTSDLIMHH